MVLFMARPLKHPDTGIYWFRQRVPGDVSAAAKGKLVSITVDDSIRQVRVGVHLKVTLRTKDPATAKARFTDVQSQVDLIWSSFRNDEVALTLKQCVALSGEVYAAFRLLEDNPGSPEKWADIHAENAAVLDDLPGWNPLTIGDHVLDPHELRFGPFIDATLRKHHLRVTPASRATLLEHVPRAMQEAAALLERRAGGDFGPDKNAERFPKVELPAVSASAKAGPLGGITFTSIITAERKHRESGVGAKYRPFPEKTVAKYESVAAEFAKHRGTGGDRVDTLTSAELDEWKQALFAAKKNGARTIHNKIGIIKSISEWGVQRFKDNLALKRVVADLASVELPGFTKKSSDISAIRPDEAPQILRAARRESDPRTRWLPWLCAYTGARISEVANLERGNFLEAGGHWLFKITTTGGRSVKTASSQRYVPVHPALVTEGFRKFVESVPKGRLFEPGAVPKLSRWFRHKDGAAVEREGVSPNHGWRHLFEDLCIRDGAADSAKLYMTGRVVPGSANDYGKTHARLPGLAREIAKIVPFDLGPLV